MRDFIVLVATTFCFSVIALPSYGQDPGSSSVGLYAGGSSESTSFGFFGGAGGVDVGVSGGVDFSGEGTLKDYAGQRPNEYTESRSLSVNFLLGGYYNGDGNSSIHVHGLLGSIITEERCPSGQEVSYLGYDCYADVGAESDSELNTGVMVSFTPKSAPFLFGIRYTKHSTGFIIGIGGAFYKSPDQL